MKSLITFFLLTIVCYSAVAQCTAPVITASGPTTFCPGGNVTLSAPTGNVWTQKADFGGAARGSTVGFSIGSKGYIGTGQGNLKDFWEYDPATNIWTQKADFGGTGRGDATGFSIGSKGYIGTGYNSGITYKDFWEYDPSANVWTQRADFGGSARPLATGFSIGGKGYIGLGSTPGSSLKDFWEYDPSTDVWTRKADFGGAGRFSATGFAIGNKGYIGTGTSGNTNYYKDFWEYDPATDIWTQKADFGGEQRYIATGFSIGSKGYIGTGRNVNTNYKDFWEYDPSTDVWIQKEDFSGPGRRAAIGFSIGSKGYIGAGWNGSSYTKDFREYDPGYTYQWSTGAKTSSIDVNTSGNYTVTTTNALDCSATSAATIVTVSTPVAPVIAASGPVTFCEGGSVTLAVPASDSWTPKADFVGAGRTGAVGFSIGSKGYIGTGSSTKDFWEYDPTTGIWAQKADFGGTARTGAAGFSIGSKGYIGTGVIGNTITKDFWEYDHVANKWTRKADFGGTERVNATGFSIGGKGYIGTGLSAVPLKDFWEYDPATDKWTQKAAFEGSARGLATGFSIGSKGYLGTGNTGGATSVKDFWEYDPAADTWAKKADFGGIVRGQATGFSIGSTGFIGLGVSNASIVTKDFWEYNPATDTWMQKVDFSGGVRFGAPGFSIGGKGYVGLGASGGGIYPNSFWEYNPGYSYSWSPGGQTTSSIDVIASGNYTVTATTPFGCSATSEATTVTVNHSTTGEETVTACNSYEWNRTTYTTSGDKTHLFTGGNATGCDSTATLHLTINHSTTGEETVTACNSYTWNGTVYTTSGDKTHLFTGGNATGCDSTATLYLTINHSTTGEETVTACNSYTWNGTVYTTSGDKTHLFTGGNATGCDSTATLHLTINHSNSLEKTVSACNNYTLPWGTMVTSTGDYSHIYTNSKGCDSIVTVHVMINTSPSKPVITANGSTTFCPGGSVTLSAPAGFTYKWSNGSDKQSITVNASGSYNVTVTNTSGCSSTSDPVIATVINDTQKPVLTCPAATTLCYAANETYTIAALQATDNCTIASTSYVITGATSRTGSGSNASGIFKTGTSTITWTVKDVSGNVSTCQTTVVVNTFITVSIADVKVLSKGVDANTVYVGYTPAASITLTAAVSGGSGSYTYKWSTGATTQSIKVSPTGATTYTVTIGDAKGCTGAASKMVKVVDARCGNKVNVCHGGGTLCIDQISVPDHLNHGDYLGSCRSGAVVYSGTAARPSVKEEQAASEFTVKASPNPTTSYFKLTGNSNDLKEKIHITVIDETGRFIETRVMNANETLQLGNSYHAGVYFAQAVQGNKKVTVKLIKQAW